MLLVQRVRDHAVVQRRRVVVALGEHERRASVTALGEIGRDRRREIRYAQPSARARANIGSRSAAAPGSS